MPRSLRRTRDRAVRLGREAFSGVRRALRLGRREPPIGPPIFIVGCGHSGTTLLLAMLACHPRLYAAPFETSMAMGSSGEMDWFVRMLNRRTAEAGRARWVEKTPRHVHKIGRILERFPAARVIVVRRDGRDVACSIRDRTGDLDAGITRWLDDNRAADPFLGDARVRLVAYEALVEDPEAELRRLMDFLGEPFAPEMLEHETSPFRFLGMYRGSAKIAAEIEALEGPPDTVSGSDHRLYRSWQARQSVFDGTGRWRTDLDEAESTQVEARAGDMLRAYGYGREDTDGG